MQFLPGCASPTHNSWQNGSRSWFAEPHPTKVSDNAINIYFILYPYCHLPEELNTIAIPFVLYTVPFKLLVFKVTSILGFVLAGIITGGENKVQVVERVPLVELVVISKPC